MYQPQQALHDPSESTLYDSVWNQLDACRQRIQEEKSSKAKVEEVVDRVWTPSQDIRLFLKRVGLWSKQNSIDRDWLSQPRIVHRWAWIVRYFTFIVLMEQKPATYTYEQKYICRKFLKSSNAPSKFLKLR